jgi:hypothetical protein
VTEGTSYAAERGGVVQGDPDIRASRRPQGRSMYSQHSIAAHRRSSRPETTVEMTYGLACTMCGRDLREPEDKPAPDAVPVGRADERQTFACRGVCARFASGSADGLDEEPTPLDERIAAFAQA